MGHSKDDVVATAIGILDEYGLPGLSMRRLATMLGVQQSALYWHFESKQVLLAAMAEEILRRGAAPASGRAERPVSASTSSSASADGEVVRCAVSLHETLLRHRDGAELVSTVHAFGLGAEGPHRDLVDSLTALGAGPADASAAATVILHFVFGYTFSEQQHRQASSVGAVEPRGDDRRGGGGGEQDPFRAGLGLVLDGVRARLSGSTAT